MDIEELFEELKKHEEYEEEMKNLKDKKKLSEKKIDEWIRKNNKTSEDEEDIVFDDCRLKFCISDEYNIKPNQKTNLIKYLKEINLIKAIDEGCNKEELKNYINSGELNINTLERFMYKVDKINFKLEKI